MFPRREKAASQEMPESSRGELTASQDVMLPLNYKSQGKLPVWYIDTPLTRDMSKIVPRAAESAHGELSTTMPDVNNSNSKPDPVMSRLYKSRDVKDTPKSQMLVNQVPSQSETSSTTAHRSVLRSSPHDGTMKPVKPPNHFAVRLHHRAEVARCSQVPEGKSGDEAVHQELHSPTFRPVLGLCQMNAVPPPLSL